MSKDIWHKLPEQPENGKDVIERWHHLGIHYTHFVAKNGIAEDNPFTDAWCYLDDLLALETELDRTRKALGVSVDMLKIMKDGLPNGNRWKWEIDKALEQITALEQKDVKED